MANHENTLLEDGFNSDLLANDVTDASANGSPMQRQMEKDNWDGLSSKRCKSIEIKRC